MKNILIIETIYLLLITIPSFIIFLKTRNLYEFSKYKGLRYYSNAFFFLAIGFLTRYIVMILKVLQGNFLTIQTFDILTLIMELFLILPGFFLFYSLFWQRFEKKHYSKRTFLNCNIFSFTIYLIAIILALADMMIRSFTFMYYSQIIIFSIASIIALRKYLSKKNNYRQLYLIGLVLFLIVWIINLVAQNLIDTIPSMRFYAYLFTISAVMILFYVNMKLTKDLE
jgi:hypothetical protein